jgi:hypothetical protein
MGGGLFLIHRPPPKLDGAAAAADGDSVAQGQWRVTLRKGTQGLFGTVSRLAAW